VLNLGLVQKFFGFSILEFFKLFLRYAIVFIILIGIDYFFWNYEINYFLSILIKSFVYMALYILFNAVLFKTEGFKEFKGILIGLLTKIKVLK
jgi:hypothetical protein